MPKKGKVSFSSYKWTHSEKSFFLIYYLASVRSMMKWSGKRAAELSMETKNDSNMSESSLMENNLSKRSVDSESTH